MNGNKLAKFRECIHKLKDIGVNVTHAEASQEFFNNIGSFHYFDSADCSTVICNVRIKPKNAKTETKTD